MIRNALNSLRAKPGFYGAVILAVGVLIWYYAFQYRDCTRHRELRERLYDTVDAMERDDRAFNLAEVVVSTWDRVHIRTVSRLEAKVADCPFGWDWSRAEREALVADGHLALLLFIDDGEFVDYLEFRNDRVDFRDVAGIWTPDMAVFRAVRESSSQLRLHPSSEAREID